MPTSVRVATIVMAVLAALLLSSAALLWYSYDAAVTRIMSDVDGATRAEAEQFVTTSLVPALVLGLLLALAAWFLPRRQPWARWVGLAAAGLLALLNLNSIVVAGGLSAYSLLQLVLSVGAVTSLVARPTAAWVPKLRPKA
jgi:glucan phosphoethanolaminetransferase (alkaline phosphatase superfamily)